MQVTPHQRGVADSELAESGLAGSGKLPREDVTATAGGQAMVVAVGV